MLEHAHLTPPEVEVLCLIDRAMPDGEMAISLRISRATVATHVQHLHQKLGTNTRAGQTLVAREHEDCCWPQDEPSDG